MPAVTPNAAAAATIAIAIHGGAFLCGAGCGASETEGARCGANGDAASTAAPPNAGPGAIGARGGAANGSGTTDGRTGSGASVMGGPVKGRVRSSGSSASFSAVARREVMGTTLLRAATGEGALVEGLRGGGGRGGMPAAGVGGAGRTEVRGGGWGGRRPSGGRGVIDDRPDENASRTIAASSGKDRSARHSSSPSCQHRDSSVTAPMAALRRISAMRMGPTGTPLMATYHSSPAERSDMSTGADTSSSRWMAVRRAPASAPAAETALEGRGLGGREARREGRPARAGRQALPPGAGGGAAGRGWGSGAAGRRRGPTLGSDLRATLASGDRRAHLDEVAALAALHPHRLAGGLLVGNLVLGLALFAEKLHSLGSPLPTLARKPGHVPQISLRKCSLRDARVGSSGAAAAQRSHISTALFLKPAFSYSTARFFRAAKCLGLRSMARSSSWMPS